MNDYPAGYGLNNNGATTQKRSAITRAHKRDATQEWKCDKCGKRGAFQIVPVNGKQLCKECAGVCAPAFLGEYVDMLRTFSDALNYEIYNNAQPLLLYSRIDAFRQHAQAYAELAYPIKPAPVPPQQLQSNDLAELDFSPQKKAAIR